MNLVWLMNPIWKREFLARWRDSRSSLLLFALALVLSGVAYWSYWQAMQSTPLDYRIYPPIPLAESIATRASRIGHSLFRALSIGNVLLWFVLAPLLTATGVARERERGLLELLQLSPMKPLSQIAARALSGLSFLAVLQLVTVPIYFVAFSFGGVSQEEIARVWLVVAATAFCGVGLGMALSAQSSRPPSALFGAIALLVMWSVLSFICGDYKFWTAYFGGGPWMLGLSQLLLYSHPLCVVWRICEPSSFSVLGLVTITKAISTDRVLPLALMGWCVAGGAGFVKATRDVKRTLPPSGWAQRNALIRRWKKNREERLQKQRTKKANLEGALLADLPFDRLIRFKNPLLNREVKGRFRLRQASPWAWIGRGALFLGGATVWSLVVFSVFFDAPGRPGAVSLVLWAEWILGAALVGSFASSAFAREREAGTWEGIQLSLFSPGEITRSKWASSLVAFGILSSPLWVLLFALVPWGSWAGVSFRWIAMGGLVVIASLCWISALGIWISQRAKSTASAMCWTVGILLGLFLGVRFAEGSLQVPQRLAIWYYEGSPSLPTDSNNFANIMSPRYTSLYAKETGRKFRSFYTSSRGRTSSFFDGKEWSEYSHWYYDYQKRLYIFAEAVDAWNPLVVISTLQNRGRRDVGVGYAYGYAEGAGEEDRRILGMSLFHIVLASVGAAVLLLSVKGRLEHHRE